MSYVDPVDGRNALEMTDHPHDDAPGGVDHFAVWVDHFADHHGVFVGEITADWTPPIPLATLLELVGLDWKPAVEREDQYHVEAYELNLLRAWHVIAHDPTILQDEGFPGYLAGPPITPDIGRQMRPDGPWKVGGWDDLTPEEQLQVAQRTARGRVLVLGDLPVTPEGANALVARIADEFAGYEDPPCEPHTLARGARRRAIVVEQLWDTAQPTSDQSSQQEPPAE
jgi:hypothetical protein